LNPKKTKIRTKDHAHYWPWKPQQSFGSDASWTTHTMQLAGFKLS
jgi:hypothetical protein